MQVGKQSIYDVTGLYPEFMGRIQSAGQSGVSIDKLVEQTTQVLGVIWANYRDAKKRAGELLMMQVMEDLSDRETEVEVDTGRKRKVTLNARAADGARTNEVLLSRTRVALSDAPSSITYAEQKFKSLTEIIKSMPEQMQGAMMDIVVRAANLPEGDEIIERIREMTGYGPEPKDPEKRAELQQKMAQQQQLQQMMEDLELRIKKAEADGKEARATLDAVKAEKMAGSDTDLTDARTLREIAEAEAVEPEQGRKEQETAANLIDKAARLREEAAKKAAEDAAKENKK